MFQLLEEDELNSILASLAINKIVYDYTGKRPEIELDYDYAIPAMYEALSFCSNDLVITCDETYELEILCITFPEMEQFYALCREYSKKYRISMKNNPFVSEAFEFVKQEMYGINSYAYSWNLYVPKRLVKKKRDLLLIALYPEFYQPVELVETVYSIYAHYCDALEKIRKELRSRQLIVREKAQLPALLLPERRAA